jgi:hypothetical protein
VQPVVRRLHLRARVDRAVELLEQGLLVDCATEVHRERVQEQRVDLHLTGRLELEVVLRGALRPELNGSQEDR